jgi:hypothetical protein
VARRRPAGGSAVHRVTHPCVAQRRSGVHGNDPTWAIAWIAAWRAVSAVRPDVDAELALAAAPRSSWGAILGGREDRADGVSW